jgi:hypothetical protein
MIIKKNCSNTAHRNTTRLNLPTTPPSCDGSATLTLATAELSGSLAVPAFEGSLKRLG